MAKKPKSAAAAPKAPADELAAAQKELAKLRAEVATLKKPAAAADAQAGGEQEARPRDDDEAKDAEYQRRLEDVEGQLAGARQLAKSTADQSFLNAYVENLENQAATIRAQRRAGWSVPRLLDRHRARVAEREVRVSKAVDRVEELAAEQARIAEEVAEARAHLQAKQEDLAAEQAEVFRLEGQLPKPQPQADASAAAAAAAAAEDPDDEEQILASVRRLAARKGGRWSGLLAAMPPAGSSGGGPPPQQPETIASQPQVQEQSGRWADAEPPIAAMEVEGQNAVVEAVKAVAADPACGASLAAVPSMVGKRPQSVPPKPAADAAARKARRRG